MKGGDQYLAMYPKLHRWMNRCVACQRLGYKPELPDQIYRWPSAHASNLRRYFPALEVDAESLCEQCRVAQSHEHRTA